MSARTMVRSMLRLARRESALLILTVMIVTITGSRRKNRERSPSVGSRIASAVMKRLPTIMRSWTANHRRRKRKKRNERFFSGNDGCTVLDDTWNRGIFPFLLATILSYVMREGYVSGRGGRAI